MTETMQKPSSDTGRQCLLCEIICGRLQKNVKLKQEYMVIIYLNSVGLNLLLLLLLLLSLLFIPR